MTVEMIAVTGPLGEIGHSDGRRPDFRASDPLVKWFVETVSGGICVVGRRSVNAMVKAGVDLTTLPYNLAVYTKQGSPGSPEAFVQMLEEAFPGETIFIAGGRTTYEHFMPLCTAFHIQRTEVRGDPDLFLPPMFLPKGVLH